MTDQNQTDAPEISDDDIRETEKVVASTALKSEKGWEILRGLYMEGGKKLLTTQGFTYPVLSNLEEINTRLSDPEGFRKSFDTLLKDLQEYKATLDGIYQKHMGKRGKPTEADWPVLFALSQEYTNTMHHFDSVIAPLIFSLVETLRNEYGEMIQMPDTTTTA